MTNIFSKKHNVFLVIIAASSIIAVAAYGGFTSMQQQKADAKTIPDDVLVTKTMISIQDPGRGHGSHQVAMFLPPLGEDAVYSGTLTWAASGPVELFTYHHYDGPASNSPPLYTEPSNNVTYASPLFFIAPDSADHGSMQLAANAIGFHSLEGAKFTVTATFDGMVKNAALPGPDNYADARSQYIIPATFGDQEMNYTILTESEIQDMLDTELKGWQVLNGKLYKTSQFQNFVEAFQFMYNVGREAEKMNHHPDWNNNYNLVDIYLYTWSAGDKITEHDIKLAGIIDREAAALSRAN
jgi:4a-hydroxytetrahydrobiopterin dehydratase